MKDLYFISDSFRKLFKTASLFVMFVLHFIVANSSLSRRNLDGKKLSVDPNIICFDSNWTSPFHPAAQYPYQLINGEGKHLFILNKTTWAFFMMDDSSNFLEKAKSQVITILRSALEEIPKFEILSYDLRPGWDLRENPNFKDILQQRSEC